MSIVCFRLKSGKSVKDFCRENNIHYSMVWKRLDAGMMPDEAVAEALSRQGHKSENNLKYVYNGTPVRHLLNESKYNRFTKLVRNGMDIKTAFERM